MEHLYPLLVHTQHMRARSCLRTVKCVFRRDPKLYQIRCFQTVFGLRVIIYSPNTHYFAIKLSSTAICGCMCSVISGDVSVNTTFINYPFVTMWISPPPPPAQQLAHLCKASTLLLITCFISADISFGIRSCYC